MLDPGTNNYINMLSADVNLTKDQIYYIRLNLTDRANAIKVLFDEGVTEQVDNPTLIKSFNTWQTTKEGFGTPYNLRLSAEVVKIGLAAGIDEPLAQVVRSYSLEQNYPNPFNPTTKISYSLGTSGPIKLVIFDVLGRQVRTLVDEIKSVGIYQVEWDSRNAAGQLVPTGIYFYQLTSGQGVLTKKMLLVK
jgi:hypothetical protein